MLPHTEVSVKSEHTNCGVRKELVPEIALCADLYFNT